MSNKKIRIKPRSQASITKKAPPEPTSVKTTAESKSNSSSSISIPPIYLKLGLGVALMCVVLWLAFSYLNTRGNASNAVLVPTDIGPSVNDKGVKIVPSSQLNFGDFDVQTELGKQQESIGSVLSQMGFSTDKINALREIDQELIDNVNAFFGHTYHILKSKNQLNNPLFLVFEINEFQQYEIGLHDSLYIKMIEKPVDIKLEEAKGLIKTSFASSILNQNLRHELISEMENILKWTVDFHHLQTGDRWKVIYEGKYINDRQVGIGKITALFFKTKDEATYAFLFDQEAETKYLNDDGRPMKKAYLKAPLSYARISSQYNLNRIHPVLKTLRPHLGTDYAAPEGTPIFAISDGVVTKATFGTNNGNYVKIKHDDTYSSQYLHMQKIAENVKPGTNVRQGQVIGFVGTTGLSTGPHLCFRFWKNGKQVDFLKEKLPSPYIFPREEIMNFKPVRDSLIKALDEIQFYQ